MKSKILSFFLLTVILLSVSSIIALNVDISTPSDLSKTIDSVDFTITNKETTSVTVTIPASISIIDDTNSITISTSDQLFSLDATGGANDSKTIILTTTLADPFEFELGKYSSDLTININNGTIDEDRTLTVSFINSFCELGAIDDSNLDLNVEINNLGQGAEDEEWLPLDRIKVEVQIENDKNDVDLNNVVLELALIDESGNNVADDLIWLSEDNEEIEIGDVDEDEKEEHTFEFKVPADLGIDETDYLLMIKAYPEDDEEITCIDFSNDLSDDYYEDIKITREEEDDRMVIIDLDEVDEFIEAPCGSTVVLEADVYNIGDQDQEQTQINLYNAELGLDLYEVIREDLDEGDSERIDFTFRIPDNAEEKQYDLELVTYYDYDEDDDEYDENSKSFYVYLRVKGNCEVELAEPKITAELDEETPEAIAGEQVIIKATVKNTGDEETEYTISITGNSDWSSLVDITPKTLTIAAGESADVDITLDLDETTDGDQEFTIKATYGEQTTAQKVALTVKGGKAAGITGASIGTHIRENAFIYVIVIINIILIIAIISVVRRMAVGPQISA